MPSREPLSNRSRLFSRVSWCRGKREMRSALTVRITTYRVQQSAFGAVFQTVNGCAAQPSRKTAHVSGQNRLTLQGNYQVTHKGPHPAPHPPADDHRLQLAKRIWTRDAGYGMRPAHPLNIWSGEAVHAEGVGNLATVVDIMLDDVPDDPSAGVGIDLAFPLILDRRLQI
jgi:hypothetical protein